MRLTERVEKVIRYLESPEIPLPNYILCFLAAVLLRNFLEVFSDTAQVSLRLLSAADSSFLINYRSLAIGFLHYSVFWVAFFMLAAIIFSAVTQENIAKTLRVTLAFSLLLLITPLADLLVSAGRGFDIRYVYPLKSAVFFPVPQELTPGMRLTSALALMLSFIYCAIKTKRLVRACIGVAAVYLALLAGSMIPFFIRQAAQFCGVTLKTLTPAPAIRLLALISFLELLFIFYRYHKKYSLCLLSDLRPGRTMHFALMFILGMLLFKNHAGKLILENAGSFLLTLFSLSLAWYLAVMFNNLEDLQSDKISSPGRPTVSGEIPLEAYKKLIPAVFLVAVTLAAAVNFTTLFFVLLGIGNSLIYSLPPLRLKRVPFFSKMLISLNSLLLVMLGWLFAGAEISAFPGIVILYFLVFATAAMNFIDLKDYAADKAAGVKTLPVIFGERKAKFIIGLFFLIAYLLLPGLFLESRLFWLALPAGALQFYLINRKAYAEKWVFLVYLLGMAGLLAWLNYA